MNENVALLISVRDKALLPDLSAPVFSFEFFVPYLRQRPMQALPSALLLLDETAGAARAMAFVPLLCAMEGDETDVFSGDPTRSFFFSRNYASCPEFALEKTAESMAPMYAREIPLEKVAHFVEQQIRRTPRKFGPISAELLNAAVGEMQNQYETPEQATLEISTLLRSRFTLDEIWFAANDTNLNDPFESNARRVIDWAQNNELISFNEGHLSLPSVDEVLRPVGELDFHARTFSPADKVNETNALVALERAESQHQKILRQACTALQGAGYQPLMSSSIDLAIRRPNFRFHIEIKSATAHNFSSQLSSGIMQLKRYNFALSAASRSETTDCLLIEVPHGSSVDLEQVGAFCEFVGVKIAYWDESVPLPSRLNGLIEAIGSAT